MLVRESGADLWVGMREVGLGDGWRRLRARGGWVHCLWWDLNLGWPWHRAWHHLRVGYVSLWSLVAVWDRRLGLEAILLMRLRRCGEGLLILRRNARLRGHVSVWEALLSLNIRLRVRHCPRSRLVALWQRWNNSLGILLRMLWLLWERSRSLTWHGNSRLGDKVWIRPHLRRYGIAS